MNQFGLIFENTSGSTGHDVCHISKVCVMCSLIYKRHMRYSDDVDSVKDDALSCRRMTHTTSADILYIKFTMDSDRRHTLDELLCVLTFYMSNM